jgi:hypothetical protein
MSGSANNLEILRQVKSMFFWKNTGKMIFNIIWSATNQSKEERKSFQKMYMYDISFQWLE